MAETGDGAWVVERRGVGSGLEVRLQRAVGVVGVESRGDGTSRTGRGMYSKKREGGEGGKGKEKK